jgi:GAF domain-containing protein
MPSEVSTMSGGQSVDELRRELAEAREQQAATAEILQVISSSPTHLEHVFAVVAASAARLCDANDAAMHQVDGDVLRSVAHHGPISFPETLPLTRGVLTARAVLDRQTIQVADMQAEADEFPSGSDRARSLGFRTILSVPLIRAGEAIGVISLRRAEVRPFTDRQIELLKTFADQAVIAIENTRLFEEVQARTRELQESLEYQTATSEVLNVISRSPSELKPVFDFIARNSSRLCGDEHAIVTRYHGLQVHLVAQHNPRPGTSAEVASFYPVPVARSDFVAVRAISTGSVVHVPDIESEERDSSTLERYRRISARALLAVAMMHQGHPIGSISVSRSMPGPFSKRQIELLQTFADQAVIAIENTRLFEAEQASKRELQESLEYQTATSEVLGVISRSPSELKPVLDAITATARRLGEATRASILEFKDGQFLLVAHNGPDVAGGLSSIAAKVPLDIDRGNLPGRFAIERRTVHVSDIRSDPEYTFFADRESDQRRTMLCAPLMREGELIGVFVMSRDLVRPFSERQIKLVETFADQAVIAIENTRLFNETKQALERQTATSEVLQVISSSPGNLQPIFDTILANAVRLCEAKFGTLYLREGDAFQAAALHNAPPAFVEFWQRGPHRPGASTVLSRVLRTKEVVHIADITADHAYIERDPLFIAAAELGGFRTVLAVPMLKEADVLGAIYIYRQEVRSFSDKQIGLVSNFTRQAVIAIENTRLLRELRQRTDDLSESLEQQTATSEVLHVISRSPGDLKSVFRTMLENATRICDAKFGVLQLYEDGAFRIGAIHNAPPAFAEAMARREPLMRPTPQHPFRRMVTTKVFVQISDLMESPAYKGRDPGIVMLVERASARTFLAVPMLKENEVVGVIAIYRQEVSSFTDKQVELVSNFAKQAVIAIENTRLFDEVQARNRDLTALSEVGRAVSSTLDLKRVLKTIVERAVELSGTDAGSIFYFREDIGRFELGETTGLDEETVAKFRKLDIAAGQTGLGEAIASSKPLQVADITKRPSNPLRDAAIEAGLRAAIIVPLLSAEAPLGALVLQRRSPGEFLQATVTLMQSFADQSAIALENARLFEEIAQKGRELEVASQHKSQFVANMSHELRTPLAAILGYAELIQEGFYGPQPEKSMDALTRIRSNGKHLLGLINTVLDIAKIEAGQFSLNLAEYALSNVVETVRAATESLAETKKIALMTHVPKSLPIGFGDEQRLTQVLLNLVGNAIKFTDTGEVRITARSDNGHFAVTVTDTGPGIPTDQLNRVFEQFHQVDNSNTKKKGGTGLGLAIAKQIVEMHGGRVWVESEPGHGATFQLQLPVRAESPKTLQ